MMDYNYMQVEAAKKLIAKKWDGSTVNLIARMKARQLLRSVSEDFVKFAMLRPRSNPAQYLMQETNSLLELCDQSFDSEAVPTERDRFLDANELDLVDKSAIVEMLNDRDYGRWTHEELAAALHRKLNVEDAL